MSVIIVNPTSTHPILRAAANSVVSIDGVLMYSSKPLPGAAETLRYLQRHRIPFILLTNGGGKPEVERVAELSSKLGVELDTSNFVQSHTPFSLLARPADEPPRFAALSPRPSTGNAYAAEKASTQVLTASGVLPYLTQHFHTKTLNDSTVLVLGSDASKARHIAHGYGFKSVVTPGDILKACPQIFPFNPLHEFYDKQEILPLPKPIYNPQNPQVSLEDCLKIDAILVFNDPRDWAVDIQLIMDLMLSHRGYLGTTSRNNGNSKLAPEDRWQKDGQPVLIFSNGDLLWSTGYHLSRFGQGAFRAAVEAAFRAVVSRALQLSNERTRIPELKSFQFGKPGMATYTYAEQVLNKYHKSLWRQKVPPRSDAGLSVQLKHWYKPQPFRINTVYMVGDNPESDILGANTRAEQNSKDARVRKGHRPSWKSCLVRTGVWNEEDAPLKSLRGLWSPIIVRDNVKDTVNWALEEQGWPWEVEEEVGKDEEV